MRCNRMMAVKNQFGDTNEKECDRKPIFRVSYFSPVSRTRMITEDLCKMHLNALAKMLTRLDQDFAVIDIPCEKGDVKC